MAKPSDFQALIATGSSSVCDKIKNTLVQLPVLVAALVAEIFNEDGTVKDTFKTAVGGTVPSTGGLSTPTGLQASDGTSAVHVELSWNAVATASYKVYRGTSDDPTKATFLDDSTTTSYNDTTAVLGTVYYYFIKAVNGALFSGLSAPDSGFTSANGGIGTDHLNATHTVNWKKPAGLASVAVKIWGAGGGGGWGGKEVDPAYSPGGSTAQPFISGGGGGGGGYTEKTCDVSGFPDGTVFKLEVGQGGTGGKTRSASGQAGGVSRITKGGDVFDSCKANPGKGGGGGGADDSHAGAGGAIVGIAPSEVGGNGTAGGSNVAAGVGGDAGDTAPGTTGRGGDGGLDEQAGDDGHDGRIELTW